MGDEAEGPADEDEQPILEADQVPEVHDQPGAPGDEPTEPEALDLRHGGGAADRRDVPLVAVAERRRRARAKPRAHHPAHVPALLHRHRRDARQERRRAVRRANAHHVADRKDLRMAGERQVRLDGDAARAVALCAGQVGEPPGERRRRHPGRPDHRPARDMLCRAVGVCKRDTVRVDARHRPSGENGDAEPLERPLRLGREGGREAREHTVGRLDEQHASGARIDRPEVTTQGVAGELADLTGHLDAGRPGPHDDEREPRSATRGVGVRLGGLEGTEQAASHDQGALQRLHLGGVTAPLLVAEVRVARAAGDDERVVREPLGGRDAVDRTELHLTPIEVEVDDLGHQDTHVAVALEERPQWIGDLAGRQRTGRDLVRERLEEMEVPPVDERDVDRSAPELRHRLQPSEPAADHHDPVPVAGAGLIRCGWPRRGRRHGARPSSMGRG